MHLALLSGTLESSLLFQHCALLATSALGSANVLHLEQLDTMLPELRVACFSNTH